MVSGFGRKGHAVGDIPGIRFKVVSVRGISLKKLYTGKASIRHWELYHAILHFVKNEKTNNLTFFV